MQKLGSQKLMFSYKGWRMMSWAIKWVLEDAERAIRRIYCCWESFHLAFHDICAFNFIVSQFHFCSKKKKKKKSWYVIKLILQGDERRGELGDLKENVSEEMNIPTQLCVLRWWLKGNKISKSQSWDQQQFQVKWWEDLYQWPLSQKKSYKDWYNVKEDKSNA